MSEMNHQGDFKDVFKKEKKKNSFKKIKNFIVTKKLYFISFISILIIIITSFKIYKNYMLTQKNNKIFFGEMEQICKLGAIEVSLSDVYSAQEVSSFENISGLIHFKGKAILGMDINKIKFNILDAKKRVIELELPQNEIIFLKIDMSKTKEIEMNYSFFKNAKQISNFRKQMYLDAEAKMKKEILKDKQLNIFVKEQVKLLLKEFAKKYGWKVKFKKLNIKEVKYEK